MSRSGSIFARQDGVRSGVGAKPVRVGAATLDGADPVCSPGPCDTIRINTAVGASGSIKIPFGKFDGQQITLVGGNNLGTAVVSTTSVNVTTAVNWTPATDSALILVWDSRTKKWADAGRSAVVGGGGGAPTTAQYVTLALDAGLSAERVLTAGSGITVTDGGANGPVTLAVAGSVSSIARTFMMMGG